MTQGLDRAAEQVAMLLEKISTEPLQARESGYTVFIRDLQLQAVIGVHEVERRAPSTLVMDVDIEVAESVAAESDQIADTIDYAAVVDEVRSCVARKRYFLLERLGEFVAQRILDKFGAMRVSIRVAKVGILKNVGMVGVILHRSRNASR